MTLSAPTIDGTTVKVYGTMRRGRCVMLHGLGSKTPWNDFFNTVPFTDLWAGLLMQGWQVVIPQQVEDAPKSNSSDNTPISGQFSAENSTTKGSAFKTLYQNFFNDLLTYLNSNYGTARGTMIMGVSWGGLGGLIAAVNSNANIMGSAMHMPVVQASILNPEFNSYDTTGIDVTSIPGVTKKMLIRLGTSDTRTSYALAQTVADNAIAASQPVTKQLVAETHSTTLTDVQAILAWISGTMDP